MTAIRLAFGESDSTTNPKHAWAGSSKKCTGGGGGGLCFLRGHLWACKCAQVVFLEALAVGYFIETINLTVRYFVGLGVLVRAQASHNPRRNPPF